MDTENFLLRRRAILERLDERRSGNLSLYPFRIPTWVKWGLALASRGGIVSTLLELGLTVAAPLLLKKPLPFLGRLLSRFREA